MAAAFLVHAVHSLTYTAPLYCLLPRRVSGGSDGSKASGGGVPPYLHATASSTGLEDLLASEEMQGSYREHPGLASGPLTSLLGSSPLTPHAGRLTAAPAPLAPARLVPYGGGVGVSSTAAVPVLEAPQGGAFSPTAMGAAQAAAAALGPGLGPGEAGVGAGRSGVPTPAGGSQDLACTSVPPGTTHLASALSVQSHMSGSSQVWGRTE